MRKIFSLLLVVLMTVTACASLPESGAPQAIERPEQVSGGAVLDPQGPTPGAAPEDIVAGFLQASSAGFSDDFAVARQFLTADAASSWNPTTQVRIYFDSQNPTVTQTRTGAFRVAVPAAATVDASGRYTSAVPDSNLSSEFSLLRESNGEWRIAVLDDGVTVPDSLFKNSFVESPLYFLSTDQSAFVPDLRWYPRNKVAASKARGLLEGPPSWLAPAVRTIVPTGTTLVNPVVNVEDGVAKVDLSAQVTELSPGELALVKAQFTKTLTNQTNISAVELLANGASLDIQSQVELQSYPYASYPLMGLRDGVPVAAQGDASPLIENTAVDNLDLVSLAAGYEEPASQLYGLTADRRVIYTLNLPDSSLWEGHRGENLLAPSVDSDGWVWTAESQGATSFNVFNESLGEDLEIPATWLEGGEIHSIAVSRESSRIAAVVERDGVNTLVLAGITRDASGRPTAVGESVRYGQRMLEIVDFAWVDESRLVVIGRTANATERSLYAVTLGGESTAMSSVQGLIAVSAGRGHDSIVLQTEDNRFFMYDAGAWRLIAENIESPTYPG